MSETRDAAGCCGVTHGCVFATALLARAASCECAARRHAGEAAAVDCRSPVAHRNCRTLAALLVERARFALRLPPPGRPLLHVQALRLQCGGVAALAEHLEGPRAEGAGGPADIHRLVLAAHARHASLTDLPWATLVPRIRAWAPRRRGSARP
jgi:hypothetical protein